MDEVKQWLASVHPYLKDEKLDEYVEELDKMGYDTVKFIEGELVEDELSFMRSADKRKVWQGLKKIRQDNVLKNESENENSQATAAVLNGDENVVEEAAVSDDDLALKLGFFIDILKKDRSGENSMEMYNEFKEADVLPRMIDMKVNDIIKRLKPDQYEKLKQKIRLEALIQRMVTTILTPFPARPSPKGKKKRSIDSIASGSLINDYSSDDYSSGDESTADERTDEFDFLSHFSETCKEDKKDEKDEKTNLSDAAHLAYDIVQGDLQSGKTAIAALFSIIASELSVVTLMLTNTVSSSSDFTPKLRTFVWKMDMDIGKESDGTSELFANNIYCIKESDDTAINYFDGEKGFCSKAISEQGAVLVAGDTQIQIRKSRELIETMQLEHYCLLVMDECDIVHGKKYTNNASTELRLLLGLPLLGLVGISATTIPTFIDLMHAEAQNVKAYRLYPGANHVGPEQFKSPKDEGGNDIFLNAGDLNYKNKFINNTLLEFIDSALYEKDRRGTM